jgi:hypothetical protein
VTAHFLSRYPNDLTGQLTIICFIKIILNLQTMSAQIITIEDLHQFKAEILKEIKKLVDENANPPFPKWLKSSEVRKLLRISPGTLQNLRTNGALPYSKIGGVIYYDYNDIRTMLQSRKTKPR